MPNNILKDFFYGNINPTVNIGGQEYEMLLTTRATKAIAGRYGGLENLGEKLMKAENFEMALDEIVWLITLLCNQPMQACMLTAE